MCSHALPPYVAWRLSLSPRRPPSWGGPHPGAHSALPTNSATAGAGLHHMNLAGRGGHEGRGHRVAPHACSPACSRFPSPSPDSASTQPRLLQGDCCAHEPRPVPTRSEPRRTWTRLCGPGFTKSTTGRWRPSLTQDSGVPYQAIPATGKCGGQTQKPGPCGA